MLQNTTVDKLKKCGMLLSSRIDGIYEGIMEIHKITTKIMGGGRYRGDYFCWRAKFYSRKKKRND